MSSTSDARQPAFPTILSDIQFQDQPHADFYKTLRDLRKSSLSIPRRLHSILSDADFVQHLHDFLVQSDPSWSWPVIANERCGSWYIPPSIKSGSAYFKSTDGHYGQWDLSLRRLNLTVLEILGSHGRAVVVDSTRRGKEFPDALRRTVPIWVAVWNRILFPEFSGEMNRPKGGNDWTDWGALQVKDLEASEVTQIENRLPQFVERLKSLQLDFEALKKKVKIPIKCLWISHTPFPLESFHHLHKEIANPQNLDDCNILILCSASRRVEGAEMSEEGYIQGAGDDSEGWSLGLTAQIFWKHKNTLLSATEDDLPDYIATLTSTEAKAVLGQETILINPTRNLHIAVTDENRDVEQSFDIVVSCNEPAHATQRPPKLVQLGCREGKLGSRDLRDKLKPMSEFIRVKLTASPDVAILVTCSTGEDLSIGVAVTLLCLFYNDDGDVDLTPKKPRIDKHLVKRRLAWITSSIPEANPSRSTLQAVNSFLIERPG